MNNCLHFLECAGCDPILPLHPPILLEMHSFFADQKVLFSVEDRGFPASRWKAKLAVRKGPEIGLFRRHSHSVLSIPHCLVHHPSINQAVEIVKEEIHRFHLPLYEEGKQGGLRYLQLFVSRQTEKVQLTLVATAPLPPSLIERLQRYDLWHSIWVNVQPEESNRIFGPAWELCWGEPFLWQPIGPLQIPFHPAVFAQANLPLFDRIIKKIDSWISPNESILELYAGVGAIGLCLQNKTSFLTFVESNPYSHLCYREMKAPFPYHCVDAKLSPFGKEEMTIVDPPRKGVDPCVLEKLRSKRIIYLSCHFASFQNDEKALRLRGWKMQEAVGFLLFPGTNHVETLVLFEKK